MRVNFKIHFVLHSYVLGGMGLYDITQNLLLFCFVTTSLKGPKLWGTARLHAFSSTLSKRITVWIKLTIHLDSRGIHLAALVVWKVPVYALILIIHIHWHLLKLTTRNKTTNQNRPISRQLRRVFDTWKRVNHFKIPPPPTGRNVFHILLLH